jgi:DUF1365 family protein
MSATVNFIQATTNSNLSNDQAIEAFSTLKSATIINSSTIKDYYFTDNLVLNSITFPISNQIANFKHALIPATLEQDATINYKEFFFQPFADIYPRSTLHLKALKQQLKRLVSKIATTQLPFKSIVSDNKSTNTSSYLFLLSSLLTSKLNSYTTTAFMGVLLLYQLYLYDFELAEYFL